MTLFRSLLAEAVGRNSGRRPSERGDGGDDAGGGEGHSSLGRTSPRGSQHASQHHSSFAELANGWTSVQAGLVGALSAKFHDAVSARGPSARRPLRILSVDDPLVASEYGWATTCLISLGVPVRELRRRFELDALPWVRAVCVEGGWLLWAYRHLRIEWLCHGSTEASVLFCVAVSLAAGILSSLGCCCLSRLRSGRAPPSRSTCPAKKVD